MNQEGRSWLGEWKLPNGSDQEATGCNLVSISTSNDMSTSLTGRNWSSAMAFHCSSVSSDSSGIFPTDKLGIEEMMEAGSKLDGHVRDIGRFFEVMAP